MNVCSGSISFSPFLLLDRNQSAIESRQGKSDWIQKRKSRVRGEKKGEKEKLTGKRGKRGKEKTTVHG